MRQIVLDTETTGLNAKTGDRIIEIGMVEICNRKLTGNKCHFYINPERPSDPAALNIHGLTEEFLKDKPKFCEIADELVSFVQNAELIIHNAPFDLGFLEAEFLLLKKFPFKSVYKNVIDTLEFARQIFPGKRNSLDALCARLGVNNSRRVLHGALLDAEILAEVYLAMTRGQETLKIDILEYENKDIKKHVSIETFETLNKNTVLLKASSEEIELHKKIMKCISQSAE